MSLRRAENERVECRLRQSTASVPRQRLAPTSGQAERNSASVQRLSSDPGQSLRNSSVLLLPKPPMVELHIHLVVLEISC